MRHMGQLWLKEEVRNLETRVRKSECNFSPYLVVDREALLQHMHLVKQLVFSKKFVVIIPCVGKSRHNHIIKSQNIKTIFFLFEQW